ncbi:MAG TPA: tRNA (adenosine(37)-N6)-threonylcarbamoyltransferase complex dimerization subunit type 1 TsaB [Candidatus Saccharimonadales bacterium]|nr:tRNA (adenosine(37)-N6)-threonylcarbamoyltransferase complex dimerization subunit type 1 TsaB [Candidatus Saccharimonadales bacterium]
MSVVLTIRTDKPEAEVGVYGAEGKQLTYNVWLAHRELSKTLHSVIRDELKKNNAELSDLGGIVVYQGPGSFTGLRIGITVANALAHELKIPIVGAAQEDKWLERGLSRLADGDNDQLVMPEYGGEANITLQKK